MKKIIKPLILLLILLVGGLFLVKPIINNLSYGIDLQGGFEILYNVEPLEEGRELTSEDLQKTYNAIVKRIDTLGVSEPVITIEGDNLIRVQLPGVSNEDDARNRISTTAVLSFRDTEDELLLTSEVLGRGGASLSQNDRTLAYQVKLDINDIEKFYNVTNNLSKRASGKNMMVVWLDFDEKTDSYEEQKNTCGSKGNMKCISAAYVNQGLNSKYGNFTFSGIPEYRGCDKYFDKIFKPYFSGVYDKETKKFTPDWEIIPDDILFSQNIILFRNNNTH